MARARSRYVCLEWGSILLQGAGRCVAWGGWNSLIEEATPEGPPKSLSGSGGKGARSSSSGCRVPARWRRGG